MADGKSDTTDQDITDETAQTDIQDAEIVEAETIEEVTEPVEEAFHEAQEAYEEHEEQRGSFSSKVLTWLVLLIAGAAGALWGGPKLAPQLPEWAAPAAKFLTPGGDAAVQEVTALRGEVETQLAGLDTGPDAEQIAQIVQEQLASVQAQTSEQITALEAQIAPADLSGIESRMNSLETKVEGFAAELGSITESLQTAGTDGGSISPEVLAEISAKTAQVDGLRAEIGEFSGQVGSLTARLDDVEAAAAAKIKEAEAQAMEAEAEAQAAQESAQEIASASAIKEAFDTLGSKVAENGPYADELAAYVDLSGAEVPQILTAASTTGITSIKRLQEQYTALSHDALRASIKTEASDEGGTASKLGAFFKSQVATRSLTAQEGDSADAVLSRIDAALANGDLEAVSSEADTLPDASKGVLENWLNAVDVRQAVLNALSSLTSQPS